MRDDLTQRLAEVVLRPRLFNTAADTDMTEKKQQQPAKFAFMRELGTVFRLILQPVTAHWRTTVYICTLISESAQPVPYKVRRQKSMSGSTTRIGKNIDSNMR